jgi:energy-converting hydrogenase B subunit Q
MNTISLTIKSVEEPGVLNQITDMIASKKINITYTYLYIEKKGIGTIYLELENVDNIEELLDSINTLDQIISVEVHPSLNEIYGKRIIIIGGGAQVSQVAMGAVSEADRHNIRGEKISVDTIPLVGEDELSEAVLAVGRLPRVSAVVLAGSIMGGKITKAVKKIKDEHANIIIVSLNMAGSVPKAADLIVTDPIQAGVMSVMAIADTAVFNVKKMSDNKF